jgi:ABC-type transporter Mla subunit MlaD
MNPSSAQQAALRLLLEDVDPLLQRAEEATQTLTKVREELNADLMILGQLVQQSLDAQPLLLEAGRKLGASAARIEAAAHGNVASQAKASRSSLPLWRLCAISAGLSALIVSSAIWAGARDVLDQARVGRALMAVWPSVDAVTRGKIHEHLGKS